MSAVLLAPLLLATACFAAGPRDDRPAPGADAASRPPVPSFSALRTGRFEGVLHGAGPLWDPDEHDAYRAALPGHTQPVIVRHGINLEPARKDFDEQLEVVRSDFERYPDELPLLTLQFNRRNREGPGEGLDAEVAAGRYDRRVLAVARMLRTFDRPVFVRVGAEVNGPWNGYVPKHFPDAYRRIVRLLREHGPEQMIFVWNVKLQLDPEAPYSAWYPGDEFVDWWSIDLFGEDLQLPKLLEAVHDFMRDAARRGKPVMVPECAPSGLDPDEVYTWRYWFARFFGLIERYDHLKAFCYSSRDFANKDTVLAHWGDMRIDRSDLLDRYRAELERAVYIHGPSGFGSGGAPGDGAETGREPDDEVTPRRRAPRAPREPEGTRAPRRDR